MSRWVKAFAGEPDDLTLIALGPTWWTGRPEHFKLSSYLYILSLARAHLCTHLLSHACEHMRTHPCIHTPPPIRILLLFQKVLVYRTYIACMSSRITFCYPKLYNLALTSLFFSFFWTDFCSLAWAGVKFTILLPQPPHSWNYRPIPPCQAVNCFSNLQQWLTSQVLFLVYPSGATKCSRFFLHVSWPWPWISHLSKEPCC